MSKASGKAKPRTIRLFVIPQPAPGTRTVMDRQGEGTVVFESDLVATTMVCGKCGAPLVVGMRIDQIRGFVLRCNRCGSYNETLA